MAVNQLVKDLYEETTECEIYTKNGNYKKAYVEWLELKLCCHILEEQGAANV